MDIEELKQAVKGIELSEEARERIIQNCRSAVFQEEKLIMQKHMNFRVKKYTAIAAVVVICLCTVIAAAATGQFGYFRDIATWSGTVTGVEYEQANHEISVDVTVVERELDVSVTLLVPDALPYRDLETIGIGSYQILDPSGNPVAEGGGTDSASIIDSSANLQIPVNALEKGAYKLVIHSIVGGKKADQPLNMNGIWEYEFVLEK